MMAIIGKEWRRFFRSPGTAWAIAGYLLLPVIVAALSLRDLYSSQGIMPHLIPMLGAHALNVIGTWQILLLAMIVPWMSTSALTHEVEGATLDLVVVAGRRLIGVVFGKLVATVLFLMLLVLSGLPVFALPLMVGGVNWTLMGRVVALEMATVVVMAGVGLAISAFGRRSGNVALAGVALGLVLTLGMGLMANMSGGSQSPDQQMMMMKMGMGFDGQNGQSPKVPKWLYGNPLVGLNSALNQPYSSGMFGLPGSGSGPVYKTYHLWQVQVAGAAPVALVGGLMAWLVMSIRLRWRWPRWRLRAKEKTKEVPANG